MMNALPVNNRFVSGVETKSERFCNRLLPYMSLFGGSHLAEWERNCLKSSASCELEGVTARTYIGMIADCEDDVLSTWAKLFCVRALIQELEQIPVDSNNDLKEPWIVKTGVAELYRVFPAHTTRVEIAQWLESIFDVSIAIRRRDGALSVCQSKKYLRSAITMYILSEVIEREISTPEIFESETEARDEMCSRIAAVFDAETDKVKKLQEEAVLNNTEVDSDEDEFSVLPDSAYGTRYGKNYDWKIHSI